VIALSVVLVGGASAIASFALLALRLQRSNSDRSQITHKVRGQRQKRNTGSLQLGGEGGSNAHGCGLTGHLAKSCEPTPSAHLRSSRMPLSLLMSRSCRPHPCAAGEPHGRLA
jgi:hypothetical protein